MKRNGISIFVALMSAYAINANAYDVELLVTYDSQAKAVATKNGTSIDSMISSKIASANTAYARQNIPITLVVNEIKQLELGSDGVTQGQLTALGTNAAELRDAYLADYVSHFTVASESYCGIAGLRTTKTSGYYSSYFSSTGIDCSSHVLPHELGHNFGLSHSIEQNGAGFVYSYGTGYQQSGVFGTIMVGNYLYSVFDGGTVINYFSDPDYYHSKYGYLGTSATNARLALQNIAPYITKADECVTYSHGCHPGVYTVATTYLDTVGNSTNTLSVSMKKNSDGTWTGTVPKDSTYPFTNRTLTMKMAVALQDVIVNGSSKTLSLRDCSLTLSPTKSYSVIFSGKSESCVATEL